MGIQNRLYHAARAVRGGLARDAMANADSEVLRRVAKSDFKYNSLGSAAKRRLVEKYGTKNDQLHHRIANTATNASRLAAVSTGILSLHARKKLKEAKERQQQMQYQYY